MYTFQQEHKQVVQYLFRRKQINQRDSHSSDTSASRAISQINNTLIKDFQVSTLIHFQSPQSSPNLKSLVPRVQSTYSFPALILFTFHQNLPKRGCLCDTPLPHLFVCPQNLFSSARQSSTKFRKTSPFGITFPFHPSKVSAAIIIIQPCYDESLIYQFNRTGAALIIPEPGRVHKSF